MADNTSLNPDLRELHEELIKRVVELADAIGRAPDSDTVDAIIREMQEVNHRITLVGNLLFTRQTRKVETAMNRVREAMGDVKKSIARLEGIVQFVKDVSSFLALVDKVIDAAKVVTPAVL
jgi:hypothetical protein